jgi:hypothetical protein
MIFLDKENKLIKEKYTQLFLSLLFGRIRTITIHKHYAQAKKRENRMINLLQENKEMESQRTSIHICNSHEPTLNQKLQKSMLFCQRSNSRTEKEK